MRLYEDGVGLNRGFNLPFTYTCKNSYDVTASSQVVLTVQQRTSALRMGSPSLHNRPVTTPTSSRITGPQPVDNEKQYQLQLEKEQYYRLMIEKEQNYIDLLRSQIASSPDEKKYLELAKTEKNLQTLQTMLMRSQNEQQYPSPLDHSLSSTSPKKSLPRSSSSPNGNTEVPPPLPKRNTNNKHGLVNGKVPVDLAISNFLNNEINANMAEAPASRKKPMPPPLVLDQPPPLPPRQSQSAPLPDSEAVNSINKQMSYPLVATTTPLVNDYSPNPSHQRTKSSPETLLSLSANNNKKISESMNDLTGRENWENPETPPGTPPPPYPSPRPPRRETGFDGRGDEGDNSFEEHFNDPPDNSVFRSNGSPRVLANNSPIHAATPPTTQQPIISMEDDDVSDQETSQLEDHGHFKSLARLWEHLPHLAVFTNYILSNSDPNSLMFYLLTDLYKEGNAKEMRKWAFEIHSCFLVPGAPLRLSNVDENIAREIDEVLTKEYDKEEILRKIFWKARSRAKEELTRQLTDFQQKRTAGLGTMFGPTDQALAEVYNDKTKEIKLYESLFLEKLEPYLEEIEKESFDSKKYYTAAALVSILTRIFQIRPTSHTFERCPTFVNKEKSFKTKFIGKYSRKLNVLGHQFVAQQFYTVIICNNCHQILYGIGPQGYQCSACLINLHRHCVKQFEDSCPGPIVKKDRGIMKLIGMRHDNTDHGRIRKSSQFLQMERERRQIEEHRDSSFDLNESDTFLIAVFNAETTVFNTDTSFSVVFNADTAIFNADTAFFNADTAVVNADTTVFNADTAVFNAYTSLIAVFNTDTFLYAVLNADTAVVNADTAVVNASIAVTAVLKAEIVVFKADTAVFNADTTVFNADTAVVNADTAVVNASIAVTAVLKAEIVVFKADTAVFKADTAVFKAYTSLIAVFNTDTSLSAVVNADTAVYNSDIVVTAGFKPSSMPTLPNVNNLDAMWSKQQTETRDNNKNMTSFRNKITNRKRKNVDSAAEPDLAAEPKQNEDKKRQPKGGKNRGRNRGKKDTVNTTNGKSNNNVSVEQNSKNVESEKTNEDDDVVLRNPPSSDRNTNTTTKRYSDSFVIDNDGGQMKLKEHNCVGPGLTRAVSGFFILDHARKAANRRLSDLFRPSSTMKLSSSVENLNTTMDKKTVNLKELSQNKTSKKTLKEKNTNNVNTNKNKQNKKSDNTTQTMSKTTVKKQPSMNEHNSYLKRVKSKIYNKTKSENNSDEVDGDIKNRKNKPKKGMEINGRIPEETEATLTPNGLRKSLTHFDFRLTRQTSNLERIRPSALSSTKEESSSDGKKPLLEKAKSSSSINLNLLRTRRNKLLEQMASRLGAKDVQNEFDFIAFGSVNNVAKLAQSDGVFGSQTSLHKQPSWLHIHKENEVESKQSQPVSRSGSDRRPDAVREEGLKHQDSATHGESTVHGEASHERLESTSPDSSTILPASGNTRRTNSNINRSESVKEQSEKRKQRRNISDPSHNTTSGDVELERHTAFSNTESGSSSNSSISCNGRLSESPSNSTDVVGQPVVRTNLDSDSDMEADTEPWQNLVPLEELKNLSPHEKKRQDVINELFHTEGSHVRNLKVLYKIFYKKIHDSQMLKPDELSLIFPNIKEMLDIHTEINKEMRRQRKEDPLVKEIGEMMLKIFDEKQGEALKKAAATFCERQQLALEFIKKRRERDSKFDALLTECEKKRQCRRLPFQGILPTEMQRLSKYPLLLERLISSIESNKDKDNEQVHQEELSRLRRAHHMSKEILNYVNEAAKVAHNRHRLEEIQKHLDTSNFERSEQPIALEFKTLDLTKYRLILEGGMQLRRPNKAVVPVHILLLEEAVVILHRESDKFLLKFFQSQPSPLSPIIKMNTLLVRYNAVCKNALFLVNMSTNNSQMYDLIAEDESKRNVWFKHFSDAAETYNRREGKTKRSRDAADDESDSESVQDLPAAHEVAAVQAEAVGGDDSGPSTSTDAQATTTEGTITEDSERVKDEESASVSDVERDSTASPDMVAGGGVQTSKVSAEDWPLIQPSQVNIAVPPVHTAESMLTPLEQIRRKDALVNQALEDKESLVADMLSIPREHFQHIADMATVDNSASREPSERVLASIFQVDQLQKAVNSALNVSEMDAITAKGGKHPTCASQDAQNDVTFNLPVGLVRDIATSLSTQLTTLLSEVKQMEEERDRLRRELHKVRERLHQEHNLHSPVSLEQVETETSTDCASETTTSLNDNNQVISKSDCEEEEQ